MRVTTAFNKMLGLVGASVVSVTFTPEGIVLPTSVFAASSPSERHGQRFKRDRERGAALVRAERGRRPQLDIGGQPGYGHRAEWYSE